MILEELNNRPLEEAKQLFTLCCTSTKWVKKMMQALPFSSEQQLIDSADNAWFSLAEEDYFEAFEGHPRIGDVSSLRAKYANTKALASGEQSGVDIASERTIQELATDNERYFKKFGFIFIVCASGKTAAEMLTLLQQRLSNERAVEIKNAAEEQRKIFQIRLKKILS